MNSTDAHAPDASKHNLGPKPQDWKKMHISFDAINTFTLLNDLPHTQKVENSQPRTLGPTCRQQYPQHLLAGRKYSSDDTLLDTMMEGWLGMGVSFHEGKGGLRGHMGHVHSW